MGWGFLLLFHIFFFLPLTTNHTATQQCSNASSSSFFFFLNIYLQLTIILKNILSALNFSNCNSVGPLSV